jgi:hypothetical protein
MLHLVIQQLKQAKVEAGKELSRIDQAIKALSPQKRARLSKDAIRRIAEAQKKRWAKFHRQKRAA